MTLVKLMSKNVKELLDEKVIEFNSRIDDNPEFSKKIQGKDRTICICVSDGDNYATKLENMRVEKFVKTDNTDADLVVTANSELLVGLINREISPIKVYISGALKVHSKKIMDMLLLKQLF